MSYPVKTDLNVHWAPTAKDRCDRCGARAYVQAKVASATTPLLFCAHHGRQHLPKLRQTGAQIRDFSHQLQTANV